MVVVVVFGHSQARRLGESKYPDSKGHPGIQYKFVARGGLKWQHLMREESNWVKLIVEANPHILTVIMGTNDLCWPDLTPAFCMEKLKQFLKAVYRALGRRLPVILLPCFSRMPHCNVRKGQLSIDAFNKRAREFNSMLEDLDELSWHVHYVKWYNKNKASMFLPDGIHLSPVGNKQLFFKVQVAVLKC